MAYEAVHPIVVPAGLDISQRAVGCVRCHGRHLPLQCRRFYLPVHRMPAHREALES